MKKLFQIGTILCSLLITQYGYSAAFSQNQDQPSDDPNYSTQSDDPQNYDSGRSAGYSYNDGRTYSSPGGFASNNDGSYSGDGQGSSCCAAPADHPCGDQAVGDCWCKYVHYKPCYYTTRRCVDYQVPCTKRCCRWCPKYYEVQRCRMVPQYYCETCCKQELEWYDVPDCKTCQKWVCDTHCKYVPCYYWKHTCANPSCSTPCPR